MFDLRAFSFALFMICLCFCLFVYVILLLYVSYVIASYIYVVLLQQMYSNRIILCVFAFFCYSCLFSHNRSLHRWSPLDSSRTETATPLHPRLWHDGQTPLTMGHCGHGHHGHVQMRRVVFPGASWECTVNQPSLPKQLLRTAPLAPQLAADALLHRHAWARARRVRVRVVAANVMIGDSSQEGHVLEN